MTQGVVMKKKQRGESPRIFNQKSKITDMKKLLLNAALFAFGVAASGYVFTISLTAIANILR